MRSPCECPLAGWCERHQRKKSVRQHQLCLTSEEYRALWDAQSGKSGEPSSDFGAELARQFADPRTAMAQGKRLTGGGLVAPLETADAPTSWQGRAKIKPWQYPLTVVIPHLNTPDILAACLRLHQLQTLKPYVVIIDTGSGEAVRLQLEALRSESVEVHYIRAHGYIHSSAPVTTAMDLAFALCRTQLLVSTHTDVFLRRRNALAWLTAQCNAETPVVGWEMSPRNLNGWHGKDTWQGTVSHAFTAYHMPTMRRIGATWSFERYYEAVGMPYKPTHGFPDTEQTLALCLSRAGIKPKLHGTEPNFERHITDWFDHPKSITGLRAYQKGTAILQNTEAYAAPAIAEARARIQKWSNPQCVHLGPATGELRPCPPPSQCSAKVFACAHPSHETTTLRECEGCRDRVLN